MKIVFLSDGNSIHTARWVNAFAERKHDVYLLYNKDQSPKVHPIDERVTQISLKYGGKIGYYINKRSLKKCLRKISPDVVNAHYASGYGTLARIAKVKRLILSVWGSDVYDFPYRNMFNYYTIKKNLLYTNFIASTSECMAGKVRELLSPEKRRIEITPFGVDLEKFNPDLFFDSNKELQVGVIKNLQSIYGIDDFLKAMKIVLKEIKKIDSNIADRIRIKIYGEGEQEEELKKLTNTLGLNQITTFEGRVSNDVIPKILSRLAVFCNMTKVSESFGVSVVEAMAMKVPVVVTDAEGTQEVTNKGEAGVVVEKGNIVEMADQIEKLLLNKEYRRELGRKERIRVEEVYDWEKNVDIMEKYYREVIESAKQLSKKLILI